MLQWNPKITALLVLGTLVAIAAVNGLGSWLSLNFTW
jgi:Flp pilus assembly pilin Flp